MVACYPDDSVIDTLIQTLKVKDSPFAKTLDEKVVLLKTNEIQKALTQHRGNISKAAQTLGMNRTTLIHQMSRLKIGLKS